ncbi:MAG: leader peptidase (prepilin peptidase)/N-methyltransferase [Halieaceae bacterium]|jgi:leader peptidase (prepilin peptidase)/N-methyltransferase
MDLLAILHEAPLLLAFYLFAIGLVVGSFLNVVIYRLPIMMKNEWERECRDMSADIEEQPIAPDSSSDTFNLATPNSHCPGCKKSIRAWQNVPVFSYLALGGKCYNCATPIPIRYPTIEMSAGCAAVVCGFIYGAQPELLAVLALTWTLLVLAMIDVDHQLLPDSLTLPLLWLGLLVNYSGMFVPLQDAVLGAIFGYGSLWTVYWGFKLATGKEGMGHGDFKLLAALGAWMGWQILPLIIVLSSLVGAVIGIGMIVLKGRDRSIPIPFGPYLAAAGWLALLWGQEIMAAYLHFSGLDGAG